MTMICISAATVNNRSAKCRLKRFANSATHDRNELIKVYLHPTTHSRTTVDTQTSIIIKLQQRNEGKVCR